MTANILPTPHPRHALHSASYGVRQAGDDLVVVVHLDDSGILMEGLVGEIVHDRTLADARNERFIAPRIADITAMIHRVVARGGIDPLPNRTLAAEMLIGALHFRSTVTGEPIDLPLVDDLVPSAMRMVGGLSTQSPSRPKRRGSPRGRL